MSVTEIQKRVEEIRAKADDDEAAHSDEDSLWADVLVAIRDGAKNPAELAAAALETLNIKFSRWCA